jgi:predicted dehydrogenase
VIKLGILDFDTSHCVEFTKRLNHQGVAPDQWVEGARVVVGCPGTSRIAPERIPTYTKAMADLGVALVEKPEALLGKVDGMLIESLEGGMHLERARPFLEAGIPCFIDKPMACSHADAKALAELAARRGVPIFSSSSLRFAPDVVAFTKDASHGKLHGVLTYGPAPTDPRNPGLFHYGIHAAEMLYTLMGPGCERVTCLHEKDADLAIGHWKDGRFASIRGIRAGQAAYGFTAFTDRQVKNVSVSTTFIYRELLKEIVEFFTTKKAPIDIAVTVELMGFIEAALRSASNHGSGEMVG